MGDEVYDRVLPRVRSVNTEGDFTEEVRGACWKNVYWKHTSRAIFVNNNNVLFALPSLAALSPHSVVVTAHQRTR